MENAEPNGCKPNGCKPMSMEVCGGYKTHRDDLSGSTTIEKDCLWVGGGKAPCRERKRRMIFLYDM